MFIDVSRPDTRRTHGKAHAATKKMITENGDEESDGDGVVMSKFSPGVSFIFNYERKSYQPKKEDQ